MTFGCRSCDTVESTKIAQSEIYQDYTVDASDSGTHVTATFRVSGSTGTTIDLDAPSKIEYNGRELGENLRSIHVRDQLHVLVGCIYREPPVHLYKRRGQGIPK